MQQCHGYSRPEHGGIGGNVVDTPLNGAVKTGEVFDQVNRPQVVNGQRASALGFGDLRVMALFQALCLFMLLPQGFRNSTSHTHVTQLMGKSPADHTPGRMTYDLR